MKRKLSTLFITSLILTCSAHAEYGFDSVSDYTGEAFFAPPSLEQPKDSFYRSTEREPKSYGTTPPIKQIRLKLQERALEKEQKIYELYNSVFWLGERQLPMHREKNVVLYIIWIQLKTEYSLCVIIKSEVFNLNLVEYLN